MGLQGLGLAVNLLTHPGGASVDRRRGVDAVAGLEPQGGCDAGLLARQYVAGVQLVELDLGQRAVAEELGQLRALGSGQVADVCVAHRAAVPLLQDQAAVAVPQSPQVREAARDGGHGERREGGDGTGRQLDQLSLHGLYSSHSVTPLLGHMADILQ